MPYLNRSQSSPIDDDRSSTIPSHIQSLLCLPPAPAPPNILPSASSINTNNTENLHAYRSRQGHLQNSRLRTKVRNRKKHLTMPNNNNNKSPAISEPTNNLQDQQYTHGRQCQTDQITYANKLTPPRNTRLRNKLNQLQPFELPQSEYNQQNNRYNNSYDNFQNEMETNSDQSDHKLDPKFFQFTNDEEFVPLSPMVCGSRTANTRLKRRLTRIMDNDEDVGDEEWNEFCESKLNDHLKKIRMKKQQHQCAATINNVLWKLLGFLGTISSSASGSFSFVGLETGSTPSNQSSTEPMRQLMPNSRFLAPNSTTTPTPTIIALVKTTEPEQHWFFANITIIAGILAFVSTVCSALQNGWKLQESVDKHIQAGKGYQEMEQEIIGVNDLEASMRIVGPVTTFKKINDGQIKLNNLSPHINIIARICYYLTCSGSYD
jgi:hypothetical protein